MTRKLILMRHAKSDWDDPTLSDKQRILNKRGRSSAKALGDWMRGKGVVPDRALISSAQRTRETWDLLGFECDHTFLDALYHAPPDRIDLQIANHGDGAETLLVIAHNPGICSYANHLHPGTQDHDFARYPTCATAVFDVSAQFGSGLSATDTELTDFIVPRRLLET